MVLSCLYPSMSFLWYSRFWGKLSNWWPIAICFHMCKVCHMWVVIKLLNIRHPLPRRHFKFFYFKISRKASSNIVTSWPLWQGGSCVKTTGLKMMLHDIMEQQEVITLPFVFEKMPVKTVKTCKDAGTMSEWSMYMYELKLWGIVEEVQNSYFVLSAHLSIWLKWAFLSKILWLDLFSYICPRINLKGNVLKSYSQNL